MRRWARELRHEDAQARAFRVTWAPSTGRVGDLTFCPSCAAAFPARSPENRAYFTAFPVPMTEQEITSLRIPQCTCCGRGIEAKPMTDAEKRAESEWWKINDAAIDELDEHRGSRW